jgi:hypothetical protein
MLGGKLVHYIRMCPTANDCSPKSQKRGTNLGENSSFLPVNSNHPPHSSPPSPFLSIPSPILLLRSRNEGSRYAATWSLNRKCGGARTNVALLGRVRCGIRRANGEGGTRVSESGEGSCGDGGGGRSVKMRWTRTLVSPCSTKRQHINKQSYLG